MEYPLSEIIDRYSILLLKHSRLPKEEKVLAELERFEAAMIEFNEPRSSVWLAQLCEINTKIWNIEAAIRQGREFLAFDKIGMDAIKIRNLNAERVRLKNVIAEAMGEFQEIKIDHSSEQTPDPPQAA